MNLLTETLNVFARFTKTPEDVKAVISCKCVCTWQEFCILADIEYDAGYGLVEVDPSLTILFKDNTWLYRDTYDGSEWWEYAVVPQVPTVAGKLTTVRI